MARGVVERETAASPGPAWTVLEPNCTTSESSPSTTTSDSSSIQFVSQRPMPESSPQSRKRRGQASLSGGAESLSSAQNATSASATRRVLRKDTNSSTSSVSTSQQNAPSASSVSRRLNAPQPNVATHMRKRKRPKEVTPPSDDEMQPGAKGEGEGEAEAEEEQDQDQAQERNASDWSPPPPSLAWTKSQKPASGSSAGLRKSASQGNIAGPSNPRSSTRLKEKNGNNTSVVERALTRRAALAAAPSETIELTDSDNASTRLRTKPRARARPSGSASTPSVSAPPTTSRSAASASTSKAKGKTHPPPLKPSAAPKPDVIDLISDEEEPGEAAKDATTASQRQQQPPTQQPPKKKRKINLPNGGEGEASQAAAAPPPQSVSPMTTRSSGSAGGSTTMSTSASAPTSTSVPTRRTARKSTGGRPPPHVVWQVSSVRHRPQVLPSKLSRPRSQSQSQAKSPDVIDLSNTTDEESVGSGGDAAASASAATATATVKTRITGASASTSGRQLRNMVQAFVADSSPVEAGPQTRTRGQVKGKVKGKGKGREKEKETEKEKEKEGETEPEEEGEGVGAGGDGFDGIRTRAQRSRQSHAHVQGQSQDPSPGQGEAPARSRTRAQAQAQAQAQAESATPTRASTRIQAKKQGQGQVSPALSRTRSGSRIGAGAAVVAGALNQASRVNRPRPGQSPSQSQGQRESQSQKPSEKRGEALFLSETESEEGRAARRHSVLQAQMQMRSAGDGAVLEPEREHGAEPAIEPEHDAEPEQEREPSLSVHDYSLYQFSDDEPDRDKSMVEDYKMYCFTDEVGDVLKKSQEMVEAEQGHSGDGPGAPSPHELQETENVPSPEVATAYEKEGSLNESTDYTRPSSGAASILEESRVPTPQPETPMSASSSAPVLQRALSSSVMLSPAHEPDAATDEAAFSPRQFVADQMEQEKDIIDAARVSVGVDELGRSPAPVPTQAQVPGEGSTIVTAGPPLTTLTREGGRTKFDDGALAALSAALVVCLDGRGVGVDKDGSGVGESDGKGKDGENIKATARDKDKDKDSESKQTSADIKKSPIRDLRTSLSPVRMRHQPLSISVVHSEPSTSITSAQAEAGVVDDKQDGMDVDVPKESSESQAKAKPEQQQGSPSKPRETTSSPGGSVSSSSSADSAVSSLGMGSMGRDASGGGKGGSGGSVGSDASSVETEIDELEGDGDEKENEKSGGSGVLASKDQVELDGNADTKQTEPATTAESAKVTTLADRLFEEDTQLAIALSMGDVMPSSSTLVADAEFKSALDDSWSPPPPSVLSIPPPTPALTSAATPKSAVVAKEASTTIAKAKTTATQAEGPSSSPSRPLKRKLRPALHPTLGRTQREEEDLGGDVDVEMEIETEPKKQKTEHLRPRPVPKNESTVAKDPVQPDRQKEQETQGHSKQAISDIQSHTQPKPKAKVQIEVPTPAQTHALQALINTEVENLLAKGFTGLESSGKLSHIMKGLETPPALSVPAPLPWPRDGFEAKEVEIEYTGVWFERVSEIIRRGNQRSSKQEVEIIEIEDNSVIEEGGGDSTEKVEGLQLEGVPLPEVLMPSIEEEEGSEMGMELSPEVGVVTEFQEQSEVSQPALQTTNINASDSEDMLMVEEPAQTPAINLVPASLQALAQEVDHQNPERAESEERHQHSKDTGRCSISPEKQSPTLSAFSNGSNLATSDAEAMEVESYVMQDESEKEESGGEGVDETTVAESGVSKDVKMEGSLDDSKSEDVEMHDIDAPTTSTSSSSHPPPPPSDSQKLPEPANPQPPPQAPTPRVTPPPTASAPAITTKSPTPQTISARLSNTPFLDPEEVKSLHLNLELSPEEKALLTNFSPLQVHGQILDSGFPSSKSMSFSLSLPDFGSPMVGKEASGLVMMDLDTEMVEDMLLMYPEEDS
ncbi:hypothetical protein AX16_008485 [Volvariella volvacea WC 439]|nr:hypothetical protein AX16_008485 [Volvariella volvacea WC 439]